MDDPRAPFVSQPSEISKLMWVELKQQPSLTPLSRISYMDHIMSKHSFMRHISKSLISRSFLIIYLIVFLVFPLLPTIRIPSIWSSLLTTKSTCLFSTCSSHVYLNIFKFQTWIALYLTSFKINFSRHRIKHMKYSALPNSRIWRKKRNQTKQNRISLLKTCDEGWRKQKRLIKYKMKWNYYLVLARYVTKWFDGYVCEW